MTQKNEREKIEDLIREKVMKNVYPELKKEGIEYYGHWFINKKGVTTKRKMKSVIVRQVEDVKYYLAQKQKYPSNLKWYYAETKKHIAVGWLLETTDEKFLK